MVRSTVSWPRSSVKKGIIEPRWRYTQASAAATSFEIKYGGRHCSANSYIFIQCYLIANTAILNNIL
jgi:hypothetical protein